MGKGSRIRYRVRKGRFKRTLRKAVSLTIISSARHPAISATILVGGIVVLLLADRGTGESMAAVASHVLRDPMSILDFRSPGERGEGALTQTKQRHAERFAAAAPGLPGGPHERVLSEVRERPAPPALADGVPGALALPQLAPGAVNPPVANSLPGRALTPLTSNAPRNLNPLLFPTEAAPTNDATGNDSTANGSDGELPVVVAPVPEPATWAMMIAGFLATGLAMRRSKRALLPVRTHGEP